MKTAIDMMPVEIIPFNINDPNNQEYLIIKEIGFNTSMCSDVYETTYIRTAHYIDIPAGIVEELDAERLDAIYKALRKSSDTFITKDQAIFIWRVIQAMKGNWDDDVNMTIAKINRLLESDASFREYYNDTKRVKPF